MKVLKNRLKKEGSQTFTNCNRLKMAATRATLIRKHCPWPARPQRKVDGVEGRRVGDAQFSAAARGQVHAEN